MPTLQCPNCGKVVRFEGVAGVCPSCASVVRAAKPKPAGDAPKSAAGTRPSASSTGKQSSRRPAQADLEAVAGGDEEVFDPTGGHAPHGGNPLAGLDKRYIYGVGAAVFLLLVFGLYIALRTPTADLPPAHPQIAENPTPTDPDPDNTPKTQEVIAPPPSRMPTSVSTTGPATSRPAWMALKPVKPLLPPKPITDQMVEASIKKAVAYFKTQFTGGVLTGVDGSDMFAGRNTLCVYSLLHAGEAIDDSTLGISDPYMQGMLDKLKTFEMSRDVATYERSLRASALAMNDRDADHAQLLKDLGWLQAAERGGAYTYVTPSDPKAAILGQWDNSNCQYGVLGIWAGALAGLTVPDKYWVDVEQHWLNCQDKDGGWCYLGPSDSSETPMTCAGITTLCVTAEQLELINSKGKKDARPKMSQAIEKALTWLSQSDNLLRLDPLHRGYGLYGVERAALATGYRWFGTHDWYRELGAKEIAAQNPDGSWGGIGDGEQVEAAFRVLFLSRGRQPLLMDKLRFDGDWNDRPRDVAKLTQFASIQLEKPFAWGVADLSRNWWDWLESPMLFISTDQAPDFSDEDCDKLRSYTEAGGMIFINNEFNAKDVDAWVHALSKRLYPQYSLTTADAKDVVYTCDFPLSNKANRPPLLTIGNGTRTFLVYSPKDITPDWVRFRPKDKHDNPNLQIGINLFVTAAGKSDFRNRLNTPYEEEPAFTPLGTLPIFQINYPGQWNPEPKDYERFSRWFQTQTSIKLDVQPISLTALRPQTAPVAVLTGNQKVDFDKMDFKALGEFVKQGGVLFIDSTGGNRDFADSVRKSLLPKAFPAGLNLSDIPANDPIIAGNYQCMDPIPKPRLRNFASMELGGTTSSVHKNVQYAQVGQGVVIVSDLDVSTSLLSSGTYGLLGYTPAYSQSLMKNVILWALSRYHH